MDVVGRFLCRAIVKRRRIRAVQVIAGALGAFTNSNVISRFAGRVRWGAHRLQSEARQRAACTTDHLDLLSRHWDRLYPRHPPAIKKPERVREGSPSRTPPPAASSKPAASAESGGTRNSKRSPRKKGGGGGKTRTKADSKRQGVGASPGGKSPRDLSPGGTSPASKGKVKKADGGSELGNEVDRAARGISEEPGAVDAFGEAKKAEIVAWLQQARFKHSQERIIYERFTVFPLMVELLLQHEGETHRNRLQAIERATFLRSHGQLLHTWVDKGYYAKMAHVIPPPQRMPRLFSREEGDAMFERASAKAASTSAPVSSKQYDQD